MRNSDEHSKFAKKVGKRIKQLRKERNWKQSRLATECNMDEQNISRIETGRTSPTLKTLLKIATVFKMSPAELIDV